MSRISFGDNIHDEYNINSSIIFFLESSKNIGGQELQLLNQMLALNAQGRHTLLLCKPNSGIKKSHNKII